LCLPKSDGKEDDDEDDDVEVDDVGALEEDDVCETGATLAPFCNK
jgi:hypothetical protein